jgi:hypothetical protein
MYTLYSSVRPFGISTILGAVDKDGPALYVVEPSGVFFVRPPLGYYIQNLHDYRATTARLSAKVASSRKRSSRNLSCPS